MTPGPDGSERRDGLAVPTGSTAERALVPPQRAKELRRTAL